MGVEGADEPAIVHEPGRDHLFLARGAGDGTGGGVVAAGSPAGVAAGVAAELCEHPGPGNRSRSRLGQDDLSVRVPPKMVPHLLFEDLDLLVQSGDDRDERPDGSPVSGCQGRRPGQLLAAQRGQDGGGPLGDVAAPGALERRGHLRPGQPCGAGRPG